MAVEILYRRFVERRLAEALEDAPVVLIQGPRQCGKTTLAHMVCAPEHLTHMDTTLSKEVHRTGLSAKTRGYTYFTFDDAVVREGAVADPAGFVADLPERVILDEVQRVPALFAALKLDVDRRRVAGRFLLTGSSNVLHSPKVSDSLAGRMETVRLHPLAQCELQGNQDSVFSVDRSQGFLNALFQGSFKIRRTERLGNQLYERIVSGGYPAALARPSGRRRTAWYRNYLEAQVQRDVPDIARIRSLDVLPRLLLYGASQTARLFNLSDLAAPFQVSRPTIRDYIALLEQVFLLERLPPWHSNRLSRLVKTPKLHIGDTGLASALLGIDAAGLAANRLLLGQLLETFVHQELRRQADWHDVMMSFYHFRDKDGIEVDIVIEQGVQALVGVEVKASGTVTSSDFRGLRKLRNAAGSRFKAGVVLYDGEMSVGFGDGLFALPISVLWETPESVSPVLPEP